MEALTLARIQFALTAGFHYIFPPLTVGLAWLIFVMKFRYLRSGDALFNDMARFWTKVFALSFAIGVATGIVMEFEFGTNWAGYSRYVGDIFGAPLAAEGIIAFFLESSFVGLLLFGEKKISAKMHTVAAFFVAFGATLSAFWIVIANSWQQTPAGYEIVNGRAELTDFAAAVFNASTIPRFTHTIGGALVTGSFFIAGLSALYLLRKKHIQFARRSLVLGLMVAFIGAAAQLTTGHNHAVQVAQTQPLKLAAFEGLFDTQRRAPLLLFGIPNEETGEVDFEIAIPAMLSILVDLDPDTEVQGLNDFPRDQWPHLLGAFIPFHAMFILGMGFLGLSALGLLLLWRRRLFDVESRLSRLYLWCVVIAIPFPFIANELGWFAAELGRQPWVVYNVLRTADAVSPTVPASHIIASIIMFVATYTALFALWMVLLRHKLHVGPKLTHDAPEEVDS